MPACCMGLICMTFKAVVGNCRGLTRYRTKDSIQQWREDNAVQAVLRTSVENVLRLIYVEHFEVPFIATQRKQVSLQGRCCMRLQGSCCMRLQRQAEATYNARPVVSSFVLSHFCSSGIEQANSI